MTMTTDGGSGDGDEVCGGTLSKIPDNPTRHL